MNYYEYRVAWDYSYIQDPPIPLNIDIELASVCNAKCSFCLYGDHGWRDSMSELDWDGKPKRRFMPTEMALGIVRDAAALGVPALKFNFRGESVLHKDFGKIIASAKHRFIDLLVNTNANIPASLFDHAISGLMSVTKVMVSLDSMDYEIYPKVRVGLSLDSAKKTISRLVELGHPNLWIRRVICKDNKHEKFVEAVRKEWPKGIKISEHYAFDRNHYANEAIYESFNYGDFRHWARQYCGYPSQRIVIETSGRYVPCCIAWSGEFDCAGRYPDLSLKDYWDSQWRKNLVQELRQGIFKNAKCANCTSFMAYVRPERAFVCDKDVGEVQENKC